MRQKLIGRGVQVIEKMERETGFEPATSILGSGRSIVNKVDTFSPGGFRVSKLRQFWAAVVSRI
jgi:hypothetical protein